jgi:hypothetical protein
MRFTGSAILTAILIIAATITSFYMLYRIAKEKGGTHAVLGLLFPPYLYVWGWMNSRRLEIIDIMIFWSFVTIAAIVFPLLMGISAAAQLPSGMGFDEPASGSSDVTQRGSIGRGAQVQGHIDDLFAVDEWAFSGTAGEQVSIWCAPVAGSETDPRINLLDPGGQIIASDDDGGGGKTASISNLTLPSSGNYTIRVDVWLTGPYILALE